MLTRGLCYKLALCSARARQEKPMRENPPGKRGTGVWQALITVVSVCTVNPWIHVARERNHLYGDPDRVAQLPGPFIELRNINFETERHYLLMLAYSSLLFWWLGYLENYTNPQEKPSQNSSKLRNKVKLHDFTQQRIVEWGMGLELRRKQTRNDYYTSVHLRKHIAK